ncbi:MAG: hypothetical protein C5S49_01200 [Candidatus Methanogaster sp.]|nr:MAG: hypothetical protein C5S49_01200 [ANME-2 cluster archaeon]
MRWVWTDSGVDTSDDEGWGSSARRGDSKIRCLRSLESDKSLQLADRGLTYSGIGVVTCNLPKLIFAI